MKCECPPVPPAPPGLQPGFVSYSSCRLGWPHALLEFIPLSVSLADFIYCFCPFSGV